MKHSESIAALAAALAKAQGAIPPARKDSLNPHFKSHYADLTAIWEACRPALAANGLSVVQFPCDGENERIGLTSILMHSSGEWMADTVTVIALKQDPQFLGGVLTYLRRYSLAAIVGVTATEDDDANSVSLPSASQTAKPPYRAPERAAAPRAAEEAKPSLPRSDSGAVATPIVFAKMTEGTTKAGKPFQRWRIGWKDASGEVIYGSTFSEEIGGLAEIAKERAQLVYVTSHTGSYGEDVDRIDFATTNTIKQEMLDEIPF